MSTEAQVAAFEGGKLRVLASGENGREAVLALPLNRLLVKMVRVAPDEDPVAVSEPILKQMSPFPDDALTVSCETVCDDEKGRVVIAAALPESAADDIGEQLDAEKLNVVRIDSLVLGQLRGAWNALGESSARRLVLFDSPDCLSCIVLDGDQPSAIRAITDRTNLWREVTLSLLEAEDFGGARKLEEVVLVENDKSDSGDEGDGSAQDSLAPQGAPVKEDPFAPLATFAPVRRITVGSDAALVGVAERSEDEGAINALPESWRELLEETRFKRKLIKYLAVAGGFWLLIMATLFGVPTVYGFMTDHQKSLSKRHQRQYAAVKEMKAKVDLIHKYSDHARGALEIMLKVSDSLPPKGEQKPTIILNSWSYKRDEGIRVSGETEVKDDVYVFKDEMEALTDGKDGKGERIFGAVDLSGLSSSKGGYRFNLDCLYQKEEEE